MLVLHLQRVTLVIQRTPNSIAGCFRDLFIRDQVDEGTLAHPRFAENYNVLYFLDGRSETPPRAIRQPRAHLPGSV